MPAPVPRQERHLLLADAPEQDLVGRLAERRCDALPPRVVQAVEVIQAAAADDTDDAHR
jgi:hypothetical protein